VIGAATIVLIAHADSCLNAFLGDQLVIHFGTGNQLYEPRCVRDGTSK